MQAPLRVWRPAEGSRSNWLQRIALTLPGCSRAACAVLQIQEGVARRSLVGANRKRSAICSVWGRRGRRPWSARISETRNRNVLTVSVFRPNGLSAGVSRATGSRTMHSPADFDAQISAERSIQKDFARLGAPRRQTSTTTFAKRELEERIWRRQSRPHAQRGDARQDLRPSLRRESPGRL